jgi:hypothetical protein
LPSEDGDDNTVVFGWVVRVHIDEATLKDGRVDILQLAPIGRLRGLGVRGSAGDIFDGSAELA